MLGFPQVLLRQPGIDDLRADLSLGQSFSKDLLKLQRTTIQDAALMCREVTLHWWGFWSCGEARMVVTLSEHVRRYWEEGPGGGHFRFGEGYVTNRIARVPPLIRVRKERLAPVHAVLAGGVLRPGTER
jgi:hypothetical protein